MLLYIKLIEYTALAVCVCSTIVYLGYPDSKYLIVIAGCAIATFVLFWLTHKQLVYASRESEIQKNAELYLLNTDDSLGVNSIALQRAKALSYSKHMIDDYKKTRDQSRSLYYVLQISTIVFSGITPILVLTDKIESAQSWAKWLPVVCPAIASIVASVVTSFPFQEMSISANTTVELLESEQEKFILGVGQSYRCYDAVEGEQYQRAIQSIENFITEVNNIHLKQVVLLHQKKEQSGNNNSDQKQKTSTIYTA